MIKYSLSTMKIFPVVMIYNNSYCIALDIYSWEAICIATSEEI